LNLGASALCDTKQGLGTLCIEPSHPSDFAPPFPLGFSLRRPATSENNVDKCCDKHLSFHSGLSIHGLKLSFSLRMQILDHFKHILYSDQSIPPQITPHDCPSPPDSAQAMNIDRFAEFVAQRAPVLANSHFCSVTKILRFFGNVTPSVPILHSPKSSAAMCQAQLRLP
jgi:hypothetical protein